MEKHKEAAKQFAVKHWSKALVGGHLVYFANAFIEGNIAAALVGGMIGVGLIFHLNVGE